MTTAALPWTTPRQRAPRALRFNRHTSQHCVLTKVAMSAIILCLIFKQTSGQFQKLLLYGIGTLFSLAVLNVVTAMVMELTAGVAAAMWTTNLLQHVFDLSSEGINQQSLQQGGLGLIMTMLILTIPPMAAIFFNGTMGNFLYFNAFNRSGMPGPHGEPPGGYGRYAYAAPLVQQHAPNPQNTNVPLHQPRASTSTGTQGADVVKPTRQSHT